MRLLVIPTLLVGALSVVPVEATPISYTFTGSLGFLSSLRNADGTVTNLVGVDFTVTGTTLDVPTPDGYLAGMFLATSTYDFGAFGSFTTNVGSDLYMQLNLNGDPCVLTGTACASISHIGLSTWYPNSIDGLQGFMVGIAPVIMPNDVPLAMGVVTPLTTTTAFQGRVLTNSEGQRLRIGANGLVDPQINLTITQARVTAVPEPATLTLLGLGLGLCWWRRPHR